MKTPPLLLGLTVIFWGWQTDLLLEGVAMGVILEGSRFAKIRWDLSDEDFRRIWTFCSVLLLAAAVYVFNANEGKSQFSRLLQNPTPFNQGAAGIATARSITALFRWLPMIFFPFVAAQVYSSRQEIPMTTISLILRWRWRKAEHAGDPLPAARGYNLSFPYFALCLFAASNHGSENDLYFWGLCVLIGWAMWPLRSPRFGIAVWATVFGLAVALGYAGQRNVGRLQNYLSNLNPQLLARLMHRGPDPTQVRTALGQIGRLKLSGKIVIRLEPGAGGPPTYLREASYRIFDSPVWSQGRGRDNFQGLNLDGTTCVLLPYKTNGSRVNIACYLDGRAQDGEPIGLLPLPSGSGRLENLPTYTSLSTNTTGAVMAEGPGLITLDVGYGPGETIDSRPGRFDREAVPAAEKPALEAALTQLQIGDQSFDQKLQSVRGFFQSRFHYSMWQDEPTVVRTNETPLARFLLRTHSGHCEYFATATVLLLRELGIPARYAIGYAVHEQSGKGYIVRQRDAHAWCLVWNSETQCWQDFDTTPASWEEEEAQHASSWEKLSDLWSWAGFQFSKFRWGQTHLRQYLLYLLLPILALLLYQILFRRKRRHHLGVSGESEAPVVWPGLDSEFYLLERKLAEQGIPRRAHEPLSDWLDRATDHSALVEKKAQLRELLGLHYRCRFDPLGLDSEMRERLKHGTRTLLTALGP